MSVRYHSHALINVRDPYSQAPAAGGRIRIHGTKTHMTVAILRSTLTRGKVTFLDKGATLPAIGRKATLPECLACLNLSWRICSVLSDSAPLRAQIACQRVGEMLGRDDMRDRFICGYNQFVLYSVCYTLYSYVLHQRLPGP